MLIAIDAGNSRIKWGLHDDVHCEQGNWQSLAAIPTEDAARLHELARAWPDDAQVVACNVAGEPVMQMINAALSERYPQLHWLLASAEACGVRNAYEAPERLGADRWAALIGARARTKHACLVVCAGTATTVDYLSADGEFGGGCILPGLDLMRSSLAKGTAQLTWDEGALRDKPRNTADAIVSGCLNAQLGAIERMFAQMADEPGALCLLTGGAAPQLAMHLKIPFQPAEQLVLDGLRRVAADR